MGESLAAGRYMPLGDYIEMLYTKLWKPEVYPGMPKFGQKGFASLKIDPFCGILYTNGDMNIRYVRGGVETQ